MYPFFRSPLIITFTFYSFSNFIYIAGTKFVKELTKLTFFQWKGFSEFMHVMHL